MPQGRRLADLVQDAGRKLGRSREDVKPILSSLEENWYDTVDSLRDTTAAELHELGVPQRFAKELLTLVQQESGGERRGSSPPPMPRRDGKGKSKKGESKGKGSSWDSGWTSRDRGHREDSYHHDSSYDRHNAREEKGKGKGKSCSKGKEREKGKSKEDSNSWSKGKSKGKSKDGPQDRVPLSQREYQYTHKITFDIEEIDENFPLGARIIGKEGRNVQHIHKATGAHVWLCGKGSRCRNDNGKESDEPLHVVVQSDDKEGLDKAIEITNDLVDTVLEQYAAHTRGESDDGVKDDEPRSSGKGKGKGKAKKGSGEPPAKRSRRD